MWKYTAQKTDKAPRKRTRLQQKAADRAEHKETEEKRAEVTMAEWEDTENEWREARQKLRVGPEEMEREAKRLKATVATRVIAEHRGTTKRARYAGSTPDIDTSGSDTTVMMHTTPMQSAKKTDRAFYWVPKKSMQVRVFWADSKGTMLHAPLDKDEGHVTPGKGDGAGVAGGQGVAGRVPRIRGRRHHRMDFYGPVWGHRGGDRVHHPHAKAKDVMSCGELWRVVVSCGELWCARINGEGGVGQQGGVSACNSI